jgi:hypothetical protein
MDVAMGNGLSQVTINASLLLFSNLIRADNSRPRRHWKATTPRIPKTSAVWI